MLGFMRKGKNIRNQILNKELESIDHQIDRVRVIIKCLCIFARQSSEVYRELVHMNKPLNNCFKIIGQQLRLREVDI